METSIGIDRVVILRGVMRANRIACRTGAATRSSHVFAMTSAPYGSIIRTTMFQRGQFIEDLVGRWIGWQPLALGSTSVKCAARQPIELLADVSCLGRRVGKRD